MKILLQTILVLLLGVVSTSAQTCEALIAEGRAALAADNFELANARFRDAVALCPAHQTGNVMYAATRLLTLPYQVGGSNLLNSLGISQTGRTIIHWSADLTRDSNGVPVAGGEMNGTNGVLFIRTNFIPALMAAHANLAQVQNTNFLLSLSAEETKKDAVTLDYGDVVMLRSILKFIEYFSHTISSWNLELELSRLRDLHYMDALSIEQVLRERQQLLEFANTNQLAAAQDAFVSFVDQYVQASRIIRGRPPFVVRLFNLDLESAEAEERFRCALSALKGSLQFPVVLCMESNYIVELSRHFDGLHPPRPFLPEYVGNDVVAGSFPDVTFGGLVTGLSATRMDHWLHEHSPGLVTKMTASNVVGQTFMGQFTTVTGRIYAVEYSIDMTNWTELAEFFAEGGTYSFTDAAAPTTPGRFYRLVERSDYLAIGGRVFDACSLQPIAGAIASVGSLSDVTDGQGRFYIRSRPVEPPWEAFVEIQAAGHEPASRDFWGEESDESLVVYLEPSSVSAPSNDDFANRIQLSGTQVSTVGSNCGATVEFDEPGGLFGQITDTVWWRWTAPVSARVRIAVDSPGFLPLVAIYENSVLEELNAIAEEYEEVTFDAQAGVQYQIAVGGDFFETMRNGGFRLALSIPPILTISSPAAQAEFTDPSDVLFDVSASDPNGTVRQVRFYLDDEWVAVFTNGPYRLTYSNMVAGHYYFEVRATDNDGNISEEAVPFSVSPVNDDFANRIVIVGTNVTVQGSLAGASSEPDEPPHANQFAYVSVWYTWTAPLSGPVTITAFDEYSYGPNLLAVYTGSALAALTPITSRDFAVYGLGNQVTFQAVGGTQYHIAVDDYYPENNFSLRLITTAPPSVQLTSPADGAVFQGPANITLRASASDPDGVVTRVEFFDYDRIIGTVTQSPFNFGWTNVPPGYYFGIRARAFDNRGAANVSNEVYIMVE